MNLKTTLDMSSPFSFVKHLLFQSLEKLNVPPTLGKMYHYSRADIIDPELWESFLTQESKRLEMVDMGKAFILKQYEDQKG